MPGQIPETVKKERSSILRQIASKSALAFADGQLGRELEVIFEKSRNGRITGWSDNYLGVISPKGSFPTGKIVKVRATRENLAILCGEIME